MVSGPSFMRRGRGATSAGRFLLQRLPLDHAASIASPGIRAEGSVSGNTISGTPSTRVPRVYGHDASLSEMAANVILGIKSDVVH